MNRSEVTPGLWVGGKPALGRHEDVDVIVLAAEELQPPARLFPGSEVIYAPLDDDGTRPLREDEIRTALEASDRVARRMRARRRVLCTCAMGLNRSALIAALAMNRVHGAGADEIIARIRHARGPRALSNPSFERLIRATVDMRRDLRMADVVASASQTKTR
jgi:protein-tyrosine phosphatase